MFFITKERGEQRQCFTKNVLSSQTQCLLVNNFHKRGKSNYIMIYKIRQNTVNFQLSKSQPRIGEKTNLSPKFLVKMVRAELRKPAPVRLWLKSPSAKPHTP